MTFEVFDARTHGRDRLTVTTSPKHRVVRLSTALHRALGTDHVELLWDAETERVGIAPTGPGSPTAFHIHPRSHAIGAAPFLRHIGATGPDRVWPMMRVGDRFESDSR